jgi:hypothetical protein
MTYDDVPFFIGLPNSGISSIGDGSGYMLPCNSVVAEHTVSSEAQKTLGSKVKRARSFGPDNFIDCRLSLDFFIMAENSMDNAYGFLFDNWDDGGLQRGSSTGKNFFPVMFGGNVYEECYLLDYSISVRPFEPVKCSANLKSFKPPQKTTISGYTGIINEFYNEKSSSDSIVYGHTCKVSGLQGEVVGSKLLIDINYDKRYSATQSSCIYDDKPKNYLINQVDGELNVSSTGFNMFLPYEGQETTGDISILFLNQNGSGIARPTTENGLSINLPKGSFMGRSSLGVRGGDSSLTRIQIKDSII